MLSNIRKTRYQETIRRRCISKIYQKGKTQIPKEVRTSLGASDGDAVLWFIEGNRWCVEKA